MADDLREKLCQAFFERVPDLTESAQRLAQDAFDEMIEFRLTLFDDWWMRNHYRYQKMREDERRKVRHPLRTFMADIQLGKVEVAS